MRPHLFTPLGQDPRASIFLHARTTAPTADAETAMLQDVRREIVGIDPEVPIISLETRPMFRDRNLVLWSLRAGARIFVTFGLLALFMTVVGVYGVKSYMVARRTREIGIRVALGATSRDVVGMVVRDGAVTTVLGIVGGLVLSIAAGSAIRSMLFGDGKFDTTVIVGSVAALTLAATLAAWIPARRATKVAPTLALRSE
jgi:ABC-type antimicrobial peptide transport system permease subunit